MNRISDLVVERVHLGQGSPDEVARVEDDADARARLAALGEADAAFRAAHDPAADLAAIQRKAHLRATREAVARRRAAGLGVGALLVPLAVAAALFAAAPESRPVDGGEVAVDGRAKGLAPRLVVHRKVAGGEEVLGDGSRAAAGDVLQLGYVAASARHGVLLSIDGRGAVTLHHPASVGGSTELDRGGEVPLGHGYQLDAAPAFERFLFVTGDAPIDVQGVMVAASRLASSADPAHGPFVVQDRSVASITLLKGDAR